MLAMVVGHSPVLMLGASLAGWWEAWHPRAWRDPVPVLLIAGAGAWIVAVLRSGGGAAMADIVAEVDLLVQDAAVSQLQKHGGSAAGRERKKLTLAGDAHDRFLDGPASRRFAVVDFDPASGVPLPQRAMFARSPRTPAPGGTSLSDPTSAATLAINTFGTVFQTVRMFEGPDALGRQVDWAFGSEQLSVPRAGEWANAFYDRGTRSLQFFSFPTARAPGPHGAESQRHLARVRACATRRGSALAVRQLDPAVGRDPRGGRGPGRRDHGARQRWSLRQAVLARSGNSLVGATPSAPSPRSSAWRGPVPRDGPRRAGPCGTTPHSTPWQGGDRTC